MLQTMNEPALDDARAAHEAQRQAHWSDVAQRSTPWPTRAYRRMLENVYQFLVPPGLRVLELGCGQGDLLASLDPARGVGVDFCPTQIDTAKRKHPHLDFVEADVHELSDLGTFDVVVVSDLINDLWDVETVFAQAHRLLAPRGRIITNFYSRLWQAPLALARKLGLASPTLPQNWLTSDDVANLLHLADFEVIRQWGEILCPLPIPGVAPLCNRVLAKLWPFRQAVLTNFMIARPKSLGELTTPSVSVIVPARNEAGNVRAILERIPEMGSRTEIVFVEGHSSDDTATRIQEEMRNFFERPCQFHRQTGKGKGDAVRLGFAKATGDILMILDADLTVPPEDLPRFFQAIESGKGDFINGVRLVYPMQHGAMRPLNFLGNKFFSLAFTWLLGQAVKDSLCGTKVLWRSDYERIAANRHYFGDFDPFGDFDLLFGAAKQSLKIIDLPIRYRERTYGTTNIQRWRHGWLLLKMVAFAARRIKFV